jgi:hypothetical protein
VTDPIALWLDPIPPDLHTKARQRLDSGDVLGFLVLASNTASLSLVMMNARTLLDRGLYEPALLHALTASRTNNAKFPAQSLAYLVSLADRGKLRAAGEPLPGSGPFTVYRGVAGRSTARRVRGLSWTFSLPIAAWFANRGATVFGLSDPVVYRLTVPEPWVLAYVNESHRHEEELFVLCGQATRPHRCLAGTELADVAAAHGAAMHREQQEKLAALKARLRPEAIG